MIILSSIRYLRYIIDSTSKDNSPTVLSLNGLEFITKCLKMNNHPEIQYESLWCLTNMSL